MNLTNLEFIKTLNNASDVVSFIFDKSNYMCLQHGIYDNEIWQLHCLGKYSGGDLLACNKCRADWLNSEVGELENELLEKAKKRRELKMGVID